MQMQAVNTEESERESSSSKYGREKERYDCGSHGCRDLADFHDARRKLISDRATDQHKAERRRAAGTRGVRVYCVARGEKEKEKERGIERRIGEATL